MLPKKLTAFAALTLAIALSVPGTSYAADQLSAQAGVETRASRTFTVHTTGEGTIVFRSESRAQVRTDIPGYDVFNVDNHVFDDDPHYFGIMIKSKTPQTYTLTGDISEAFFCPAKGCTVQSGVTYNIGISDGADENSYPVVSFTYKAPADGYIRVMPRPIDMKEDLVYFDTQILQNGKALSGIDEFGTSTSAEIPYRAYGVKKGQTYTIHVQPTTTLFDIYAYRFSVKFTRVRSYSNHTQKKAKTIKAKKLCRGTIPAGSSAKNWYKFKVRKNRTIRITYRGETNGRLTILVTHKAGRKKLKFRRNIYNTEDRSDVLKISSQAWTGYPTKGTWYIRVSRSNKNSSGYYELKWK